MKVKKALSAFKSKLMYPCRKLVQLFKFRLKKPVCIKSLRFRSRRNHAKSKKNTPSKKKRIISSLPSLFRSAKKSKKKTPSSKKKNIISSLPSVFRSAKKSKDMNRVRELNRSFSGAGQGHFPSPITPAYVKNNITRGTKKIEAMACDDVEDACRSFENYLVEMIVEEGKVGDLMDVEELLYCWKNLKSPVFIDLVSRFYGELCKDLFSAEDGDDDDIESPIK